MSLVCPRHKLSSSPDRLATHSCGVAYGRWSELSCKALPTRLVMRADKTYEEVLSSSTFLLCSCRAFGQHFWSGSWKRSGLIVLDLDYTIWPYWCEMYEPSDTQVAQLFPESRNVIEACKNQGVRMAVASRSPTPATAKAFLKKLGASNQAVGAVLQAVLAGRTSRCRLSCAGLDEGYFEEVLVIPYTQKDQTHFPQLRKKLGVEYSDMLFFDDESGNISRCSRLGVTSILVSTSDGVCLESFKKGLDTYARQAEKRG